MPQRLLMAASVATAQGRPPATRAPTSLSPSHANHVVDLLHPTTHSLTISNPHATHLVDDIAQRTQICPDDATISASSPPTTSSSPARRRPPSYPSAHVRRRRKSNAHLLLPSSCDLRRLPATQPRRHHSRSPHPRDSLCLLHCPELRPPPASASASSNSLTALRRLNSPLCDLTSDDSLLYCRDLSDLRDHEIPTASSISWTAGARHFSADSPPSASAT